MKPLFSSAQEQHISSSVKRTTAIERPLNNFNNPLKNRNYWHRSIRYTYTSTVIGKEIDFSKFTTNWHAA
eukprot:10876908-Karenia_brevis.AAC.1